MFFKAVATKSELCIFAYIGQLYLLVRNLNPSFSKPFGTHTFYQGGRGDPPSYLKNCCPHEPEILQGVRDTFESLRNVKVVYIVFTWLP